MAEGTQAVSFATNPLAAAQPAPSVMQQMAGYGQMAQQKIAIDQAKFNLANDHFNRMQQTLGGYAADPMVDPANVAKPGGAQAALDYLNQEADDHLKQGLITPEQRAQFATQVPTVQQMQQNPGALKQHLTTAMGTIASNSEQFNRAYAPISMINNGAGTVGIRTNQLTGNMTQASGPASFIQQLPGSESTEGPAVPDANGNPQSTRTLAQQAFAVQSGKGKYVNGQFVPINGGLNLTGIQQPTAPTNALTAGPTRNPDGSVAPIQTNPLTTPLTKKAAAVATNPLVGNQNLNAQQASAQGAQTAGALMPVGAPMGAETSAGAQAQNNAARALDLEQSANIATQTQASLNSLKQASEKFESGPMADKLAKAKNFFNQAGKLIIGPDSPQWDAEGAAAVTDFHKNAAQIQQQQGKLLGSTATALNNAGYTVPDVSNPSLGNRQVTQILQGQQDAMKAKANAWLQYKKANGGSQADYSGWENNFNQNYDPRVFQLPYMNKTEQQELINNMDATQFKDFRSKANDAKAHGYVSFGNQNAGQ